MGNGAWERSPMNDLTHGAAVGLSRRRFLAGIATSAMLAILAACGGNAPAAERDAPAASPLVPSPVLPHEIQTTPPRASVITRAPGVAGTIFPTPPTVLPGDPSRLLLPTSLPSGYAATPINAAGVRRGGHITEGRPIDSTNGFNPVVNGGFGAAYLFDGLVSPDPDTREPVPMLATHWEISPDGLIYTFTLRDGVRWHDGHPFAAEDVLFSYRLYSDAATGTSVASAFNQRVASVIAPDPRTVVFTLKAPIAPFLVQHATKGIVPKHLLGGVRPEEIKTHPFSTTKPVGTGPFIFESVMPGSSFTLSSNPAYYRGAPPVDAYVYKVIDSDTVFSQLQTGEVDVAPITLDYYEAVSKERQFAVVRDAGSQFVCFGFNLDTAKGPAMFRDPQVRRALCHAVDREAIVAKLDAGLGVVAQGIIPPDLAWAYHPEAITARYDYDPMKASAMLDGAGWRRGKNGVREQHGVSLTFTCDTSSGAKNVEYYLLAMQSQFAEIGVAMEPRFAQLYPLLTRIRTVLDFDTFLYIYDGLSYPDLTPLFGSDQHGNGGFNSTGYANPQVDALLAEGLRTLDRGHSAALYTEAQNLILADAPVLILSFPQRVTAMNRRVQNFTASTAVSPTMHAPQWFVTDGK